MKKYLSLLLLITVSMAGYSQSMVPLPLEKRISIATRVVKAKVISQRSYWNADHKMILTAHELEVYKVFKGVAASKVTVVTEGGSVGDQILIVEPELELNIGDVGVFILGTLPQHGNSLIPVGASQGFIHYDLKQKTAHDIFHLYKNIPYTVEQRITAITGINVPVKPLEMPPVIQNTLAPPVIATFSPTSVSAGTFSNLTITGSNFGASYSGAASVAFRNANTGSVVYTVVAAASQIVSWSDVQIVVKVPSGAGTGSVKVTNTGGEETISLLTLTIPYNQINPSGGGIIYEPQLLNKNSGGYRMSYSTSTANSGVDFSTHTNAKTRFEAALNTWRCNTGFNVLATLTTPINATSNDGIYLVSFDNATTPLNTGVLATAYSYYGGCGASAVVQDIDIIFKRDGTDGVIWYFGASTGGQPGSTSDFETVALHETGHNHMLGHVIAPGTVMHYAITNGTNNRNLSANDITGGNYVINHSSAFSGCALTGMVPSLCSSPPIANFTSNTTSGCTTPLVVNFQDASSGVPTSWSWSFPGGSPPTSNAQNPTVTYNAAGSYDVTLTATNANGSDGETKTNYINIITPTPPPANQDFEGTFPPAGMSIVNPDGQYTWQAATGITGRSGAITKSAAVNHYQYNSNLGSTDDLITSSYSIPTTGITLAFDLAYARYDATSYERLQVLVSTDCGATYPTILYDKSGSNASGNQLSTVPESLNEFFPTAASHWRRETINLNAYSGQSVKFKFRTHNGFGNNLFVDNVDLASAPCLGPNVWTGAVNQFWGTAGNWSCGTVPDINTDVQINSGTVIVTADAFCRSLVTAAGVNVTVNTGFKLTVAN